MTSTHHEAAPAFSTVKGLEIVNTQLLNTILYLRNTYLATQNASNELIQSNRKSERFHIATRRREKELADAHHASDEAHTHFAGINKRRRSSFTALLKPAKRSPEDEAVAVNAEAAFDKAHQRENEVKARHDAEERDDAMFQKGKAQLEAKAADVEECWSALNERYTGLALHGGSDHGQRLMDAQRKLTEMEDTLVKAQSFLAPVDRGRLCIVSAFVHLQKAVENTQANLDVGPMKSFYPDPSKPGYLRHAVESSYKAQLCLEEARKILPTEFLPDELLQIHTKNASNIGDMKYLSSSSADVARRVSQNAEAQLKSLQALQKAAVISQDNVELVKDRIALAAVNKGKARLEVEEERWAVVQGMARTA